MLHPALTAWRFIGATFVSCLSHSGCVIKALQVSGSNDLTRTLPIQ